MVAVTGAASGLGLALLHRLAGRADLAGLVGLDATEAAVPGVDWRTFDPYGPLPSTGLDQVDVMVHLAMSYDSTQPGAPRRQLNVHGTADVLAAARQAEVHRVVVVTSSDVYGSHTGGPVPLPDDAQLRAADDGGLIGDLLAVERLVADLAGADLAVTVLRPAPLIGGPLGAAYDGALPRLLEATRLLALRGAEPLWQLCHSDDLLAALELAVTGAVVGVVPVASDGWLRQTEVELLSGKRRLELPAAVAQSTAERLRRLGVTSSSPHDLDRLLAPIIVDTAVLRTAGWTPQWTNRAAVQAYLDGSPSSDSRSGAYTAAGATVALVGTAALVRRARRRRRTL